MEDYRAEAIANEILDLGVRYKTSIEHLKLQKLLYIAFGCCTYFLDRYIFADPIEAWKYGPVVPSIYYEFQECGKDIITKEKRAYTFDFFDDTKPIKAKINKEDTKLKNCLDIIFKVYKDLPPSKLISLTHEKGTPWDKHYDGTQHKEIPKKDIKKYYHEFLTE